MTKRKSTGKRLRFEVFKRDNFTCQYCGAQPPDVVLVCDHMTPVKLGGLTTINNLITSCEPCNQGKADKPIGDFQPRLDADLLYLETQQEIAELKRFQRSEIAKRTAIEDTIKVIQDTYINIAGGKWKPGTQVLRNMLSKYDPSIICEAVEVLANKMIIGVENDFNWIPYVWAVARNLTEEKGDKINIPLENEDTIFAVLHADLKDETKDEGTKTYDAVLSALSSQNKTPLLAAFVESNRFKWKEDPVFQFIHACDCFPALWQEVYRSSFSGQCGSLGEWVKCRAAQVDELEKQIAEWERAATQRGQS